MRRRIRLRRVLLIAVAALLGLAGATIGQRLAATTSHDTRLGEVTLQVQAPVLSGRGVQLYVPLADWGLRATVFDSPVRITAQPRSLNRQALLDAVTGDDALLRDTQDQLARAARRAIITSALAALGGALIGGLIAALIWHAMRVRRRRLWAAVAVSFTAAATAAAGLGGAAAATFHASKLTQPTFYASGDELQRLLSQAQQIRQGSRRYESQVRSAIQSIAGMLGDSAGTSGPAGGQRILLASDIHDNVLVLPTLRAYADDAPVVLAGDFTINGNEQEAKLFDRVASIGHPVLAVSGNHDSQAHMRRLAKHGVIVLTHQGRLTGAGVAGGPNVITVAGLDVAGFEDPLEYPGGRWPTSLRTQLSFTDYPDPERRAADAEERMWEWWQQLDRRPGVLIVHEADLARRLARRIAAAQPDGPPLAILSGHTHHQRLDRIGPVTVVDGGSAGAGGPFGAGKDPLGFASLTFDGQQLDSTDLVSMDPMDGSAQARRVTREDPDCDQQVVFCDTRSEQSEDTDAASPQADTPAPANVKRR